MFFFRTGGKFLRYFLASSFWRKNVELQKKKPPRPFATPSLECFLFSALENQNQKPVTIPPPFFLVKPVRGEMRWESVKMRRFRKKEEKKWAV